MDNNIKLEFYDILNGIGMNYLKKKSPFNIINHIKLTYDEIDLKYLKGKNYFIKVDKKKQFSKDHNNKGFSGHKDYHNKDNRKTFDNKDYHNKDYHNKDYHNKDNHNKDNRKTFDNKDHHNKDHHNKDNRKTFDNKDHHNKDNRNKDNRKTFDNRGFSEHKTFDNRGFSRHKTFDNKDKYKGGELSAIMVYC
jgi:hypothetical protein